MSVLGAGSFGTVLASLLAQNGHSVTLWARDSQLVQSMSETRRNSRYLPEFELESGIHFTNGLSEALKDASFVFLTVPSKAFRPLLNDISSLRSSCGNYISAAKGIESGSFKLMSEVISDELPDARVAALSGPNLALEIASKELTGSVIASTDKLLCDSVQSLLGSKYFRVYDNPDIYGVELAGALKNIYAIAAGMAAALGMGQNAKSMLITRSLAEMSRFAVFKGANPMTFLGLAGVGDLFVTCTSPLSRNYRLGFEVGSGSSVEDALAKISQTVEGMATIKTVVEHASENDIYMPIAEGLYQVLYAGNSIVEIVKALMLGDNNHDVEFVE